jgi:DNA recombination protein Rad52
MAVSSTTTTANTSATSATPLRRSANTRPPSTLQLLRDTLSQNGSPAAPSPAQPKPNHQSAHGAAGGLEGWQLAALAAPLDRSHVRQREQGRGKVSYLEGWQVIAEANRIFGFDGWQRSTVNSRCVAEHQRPIGAKAAGRERKSGWGVTYIARVRITITAGERTVIREGSGAGHGIDMDLGLAHESAIKEAETDATKRALMTFGNPFGLALYDKQQRQVATAHLAAEGSATMPLTPAAITALQERIRALPAPRRETFSKAFRAAFQVPAAQPSLAGLITTSRHQRWIEGFLAESAAA